MQSAGFLDSIITKVKQEIKNSIHTCVVGQLIEYDYEKRLGTFKIIQARAYNDESGERVVLEYPNLIDVVFSVMHSEVADAGLIIPYKIGDCFLIQFSERSIYEFLHGAKEIKALKSSRSFSINDGVVITSIMDLSKSIKVLKDSKSLYIYNKNSVIELKDNDEVIISNKEGVNTIELKDTDEVIISNVNKANYIKMKANGDIELLSSSDVKINANKIIFTSSDIRLGNNTASLGVARGDDEVTGKVIIPTGSSAGTYDIVDGKISTSSTNVKSL